MSLLFWYLPFMIMSAALDTLYSSEKSTRRNTLDRG
jgi:hypothetical protein